MISAYDFMYFPKYVVDIFPRNALKDGCEKTSLVKASSMISEPGRPRPNLRGLFWVVR